MLVLNGKEFAAGLSRKQIEERSVPKGVPAELVQATEVLCPASHRKAYGFSVADRCRHKGF